MVLSLTFPSTLPVVTYSVFHYPNYNDNVCSKSFSSQEQNNFRSCCPQGLRVIYSATTYRHLMTTHKGTTSEQMSEVFFL